MPQSIKRKAFQHADLTLSYLDNCQISKQPPVVLLHGFTASVEINWLASGWIDELTLAGRRVIALDARGHGFSEKPYETDYYPSDVMMEDSIFLLSKLGFQNADFIGYSMGARMSAFAAIKYPECVRKLVLGGLGINIIHGMGNAQPVADALLAERLQDVENRAGRRFRRLAELGNNDLQALACCILASRQAITAESLADIKAKTLIIVGDKDDMGGSPHELATHIKNSAALGISDCNHFNALSYPPFRDAAITFILAEC